MSVSRIRIVGWLLVGLLLLPTAAMACAMFQPTQQAAAMAAQSTAACEYYQYDRGAIVDRYGRSFTDALQPALLLFPAQLAEQDAAQLAQLLGMDAADLATETAGQQMLVLRRGLSEEQAAALAAAELEAVHIVELPLRQAELASWLIGSVEPAVGLEQQYGQWLNERGGGQVLANIDARGNYCGNGLFRVAGGSGNTLQLTLDIDYQQLAEQALGGSRGALIVLDAASGAVLAWAAADAEVAVAAHPPGQLQPLLNHLQAAAGQMLPLAVQPQGYTLAEQEPQGGITLLQAAQLAALAYTGRCVEPAVVAGVYGEQGEWLWQVEAALPEPPLTAPLAPEQLELLLGAGEAGRWHIAQLAAEERLVTAVWLEAGERLSARLIAETLLQRIAQLENWQSLE